LKKLIQNLKLQMKTKVPVPLFLSCCFARNS